MSSGSKSRFSAVFNVFRFDAANLIRVVALVSWASLPVILLTISGLAAAYAIVRLNPGRAQHYRASIDYFILSEHARRTASVPAADIAFIGDSSCAMGIDVRRLGQRLQQSAEAFCTSANAGPAGYARILDTLIARGAAPRTLIIMLHPMQFNRDPSWDERGVSAGSPVPVAFFPATLDFIKFELLAPALFKPLPGFWGLFYGSGPAIARTIRTHNGSFIDARNSLTIRSQAAFQEYVQTHTVPPHPIQPHETNEHFLRALDVLAKTLEKLPHRNVYLLLSPIPETSLGEDGATQRRLAALKILQRLKLAPNRILDTAATYPDTYFATVAHLHRWGRIPFTIELADRLAHLH